MLLKAMQKSWWSRPPAHCLATAKARSRVYFPLANESSCSTTAREDPDSRADGFALQRLKEYDQLLLLRGGQVVEAGYDTRCFSRMTLNGIA